MTETYAVNMIGIRRLKNKQTRKHLRGDFHFSKEIIQ